MKVKNILLLVFAALILLSVLVLLPFGWGEKPFIPESTALSPTGPVSVENNHPDQQEFAYAFTLERDGIINSDLFDQRYKTPKNSKENTLAVRSLVSGSINIKFIQALDETRLYFAKFSNLVIDSNSSTVNEINTSAPFAFYLNKNGSISLYDEGISYEEEFVNLALQVLPYLQVVGLASGVDQWKTREIDLIGRYKSEYKVSHSGNLTRIEKRKYAYDKVNTLPSLFKQEYVAARATILNHEAIMNIEDTNSLWANEINVSERIVMESGDTTISDIPTKFSARYVDFDSRIDMPESLLSLTTLLSEKAKKADDYYSVDDKLSAMVADKDLDQVFSYYHTVVKNDEFLAKKILANYLRLHPELSKAFVDKIYEDQAELTDDEEIKLWYVLARAGHKEAQDAYIYALENPRFNDIVRYRAIGHLRVFEQPTAKFVESLWHIQDKLYHQYPGDEADSQVLASGALFAIATLSTSKDIDGSVKESILSNLESKLYSATNDRERISLVTAIGNTNNTALIDSVTPYLDSVNPKLRSEGFKAMAKMPGDEAISTYIEAYERIDPADLNMQFVALNHLQKMSLKKESLAWASNRALQLNNKTETKRLIEILGDNATRSPAAELTLRKLLTKNISPELKSDIYKYIAPQSKSL